MNQALQLGFKSLMLSSSFAVSHRKLRIATSVWSGVCEMASKRRLLNSSASKLPKIDEREDKKMKGSVFAKENADELVVQGNGEKIHTVDMQSFREDPSKIETMKIQELRTALRSVGVPAKGNKRDLVSTFKCFLEKSGNGATSQVVEEEELSVAAENVVVNLKAKNSVAKNVVQDHNAASENPGASQRKRRSEHLPDGDETVRVNTKTVTTKKKVSVKASETSGGKMLRVEKKTLHENVVERTQSEPWAVLAHKKPQKDWIPYNPKTMRPPPLNIDSKFLKILSWNVNGLRALLKLEGFSALELAQREDFDVLCLQETKLQEKDVEDIRRCLIDGYDNSFWTCSVSKLGYSGTAIISRVQPLSVRYGLGISDHDSEGRVVTAEFDSFYLLSAYVPNSGDGLKRLTYRVAEWDPSLSNYMKALGSAIMISPNITKLVVNPPAVGDELEKSKPVILTGDLNCAHQEIDIYNPAGNKRSAGFTDEERHSFGTNFLSRGFVDSFRKQHPGAVGYTYWGYRHGLRKTNKGWRLDYFLVSESMVKNVHDSYILPDVLGSDHCPIGLVLKL